MNTNILPHPKSSHKSSLEFFKPFLIGSIAIFCIVYSSGIYQNFGEIEGYGWSNSILLNRIFGFLGVSVPIGFYPFIFGAFYILISVPLQEYFFRVLPLRFIKSRPAYIWSTTLVFGLCHIYYMQPFSLLLVFGLGYILALDYYNNKNFWWICFVHFFLACMTFTLNLA
jgi:hypothetical protein